MKNKYPPLPTKGGLKQTVKGQTKLTEPVKGLPPRPVEQRPQEPELFEEQLPQQQEEQVQLQSQQQQQQETEPQLLESQQQQQQPEPFDEQLTQEPQLLEQQPQQLAQEPQLLDEQQLEPQLRQEQQQQQVKSARKDSNQRQTENRSARGSILDQAKQFNVPLPVVQSLQQHRVLVPSSNLINSIPRTRQLRPHFPVQYQPQPFVQAWSVPNMEPQLQQKMYLQNVRQVPNIFSLDSGWD